MTALYGKRRQDLSARRQLSYLVALKITGGRALEPAGHNTSVRSARAPSGATDQSPSHGTAMYFFPFQQSTSHQSLAMA